MEDLMRQFFTLFAFFLIACSATAHSRGFELTSNLNPGQSIPPDYYANAFGCTAKSTSPSLAWKNAPADTKSFAITVYDKSAPTGSGFTHYVVFDIPVDINRIEEGDLTAGKIPVGALESITDAGKPGYFGPCPPIGRKHTYVYTVYALKTEKLGVPLTSTPAFVGFNLWENTIAKASFSVTAGPRK
jgi:Raf kinase inhibitor-like YbhB/YbcL family protein